MKNNAIAKILSNIILILIALYFIPFLGLCLILFRFAMYPKKRMSTCIWFVILGLLSFAPKIISLVYKDLRLNNFINSDLYIKFIEFGKLSITIGIIFIIMSIILEKLGIKAFNMFNNYIKKEEQKNYEIEKENNLIMQEKREKAKNTRVIKCKSCGASNIVMDAYGVCKYCRRPLQEKKENNS